MKTLLIFFTLLAPKGVIVHENRVVDYFLKCDDKKCFYNVKLEPGFYNWTDGHKFVPLAVLRDSSVSTLGYFDQEVQIVK